MPLTRKPTVSGATSAPLRSFGQPTTMEQRKIAALDRITSLREGDRGVLEAIDLGPAIVPDLAKILFAREPSGLFQTRCRAIDALAALRAFDVLADFLRWLRTADDPVERLGDDVVASAAGRAVAELRNAEISDLLLESARHRPLQGILLGLASFLRRDALPIFINALGEDELRPTAQSCLRRYGSSARSDLLATALERALPMDRESESHLRKRRAALSVLIELGITSKLKDRLFELARDRDPLIAQLARHACALSGSSPRI